MWPELGKTKRNAENISMEIEKLLKDHNTLSREEILAHSEKLLAQTEESLQVIESQIADLRRNMENHKKQLRSKARFIKRHYKRV